MQNTDDRTNETLRFLKWIRNYSGWWYLICTPGQEQMNLEMMKMLIERLYREGFYEIIFVLLMVHRNHPALSHLAEYLFLDSCIARWDKEKDHIIQEIQLFLE
ncbi:MAG: hypothetical protein HFF39_02595 [Lawsonibacter sp.]|nr:hypothetical protein [Lawsonibacter sp.]